jgi:hypothetical protein
VTKLGVRWRFAIIATVIGVVSIPTSIVLFQPNLPGGSNALAPALPFFLGLKVFEGLALGTGIAFLIFGYQLLKRARRSRTLTLLAYFAIAWYLVNWWPHDNLHAAIGIYNLWGLLAIEYAFHFTMMVAGGVLALFFYRVMRQVSAVPA